MIIHHEGHGSTALTIDFEREGFVGAGLKPAPTIRNSFLRSLRFLRLISPVPNPFGCGFAALRSSW
jgi:hypothetical protein